MKLYLVFTRKKEKVEVISGSLVRPLSEPIAFLTRGPGAGSCKCLHVYILGWPREIHAAFLNVVGFSVYQ